MKNSEYVWEGIWSTDSYGKSKERMTRAAKRVRHFKEILGERKNLGKVVEFGCGDGSFAKLLLSDETLNIEKYLGFDRSATAISRAEENLKSEHHVALECADIHEIELGASSADTVIACGLLEHIQDVESVLKRFQEICAPNAILIFTMSNTLSSMYLHRRLKEIFGKWRYGYQKNYFPSEWRKALEKYFLPEKINVFHGDWDYGLVAVIDRAGGIFHKEVGRYIISIACPVAKVELK